MENKEIELRSEEVQEVMGQIPAWIVRWGITILFVVVLALLIGSCFFKYPDVIQASTTLTSHEPVAQIISRSSGKISRLCVSDGEKVQKGSCLAVIENPAVTEQVLVLKEQVKKVMNNPDSALTILLPAKELQLGDIQASYTAYLHSLHNYYNQKELDYYPKKIASVKGQISKYQVYSENIERQYQVMLSQYALAEKQYARDSLLYTRNVLSPSEHETSRNQLLQSRYALEGAKASLENLKIQIGQLEESLLDLNLQELEKQNVLTHEYSTSAEQLMNEINRWELAYRLLSPIEGVVTFTSYWNENQNLTSGETAFTVVPSGNKELIGKALLPLARSGKVKVGQRVIVRFANFPDQEFGVVNGVISSISLVPTDENYMVEVTFPKGLITNYNKQLPISREMQAQADIVTEELRLIERFFMPLKKIFKEGLQ